MSLRLRVTTFIKDDAVLAMRRLVDRLDGLPTRTHTELVANLCQKLDALGTRYQRPLQQWLFHVQEAWGSRDYRPQATEHEWLRSVEKPADEVTFDDLTELLSHVYGSRQAFIEGRMQARASDAQRRQAMRLCSNFDHKTHRAAGWDWFHGTSVEENKSRWVSSDDIGAPLLELTQQELLHMLPSKMSWPQESELSSELAPYTAFSAMAMIRVLRRVFDRPQDILNLGAAGSGGRRRGPPA